MVERLKQRAESPDSLRKPILNHQATAVFHRQSCFPSRTRAVVTRVLPEKNSMTMRSDILGRRGLQSIPTRLPGTPPPDQSADNAFTLVELLVVIAIMAMWNRRH
jgi:prepilin-type N-terminal cleavage/methylation domain-containing protein